jgi:hypothetical protein
MVANYPAPSIRYRIRSDFVGSNHLTEIDWFRLDCDRFPGLGITSGSIVLNPIGSYSRNPDGSDGQIPSASLFSLISIRHDTETPSSSVVGFDCRFDGSIRSDSTVWTPMWFRILESRQILSNFIILRKIPIGFLSDAMRSDYRIDGPRYVNFLAEQRYKSN